MLSAAFEATSQRLGKTPSMPLTLLRTLSKATRSCRPQEVLDPIPFNNLVDPRKSCLKWTWVVTIFS